jgi:S-adenosylmethionine hydrolase
VSDPVRLDWPEPVRRGGAIEGVCLRADPFGNLATSIAARHLGRGSRVRRVRVEGRPARFVTTFGEGRHGELLALLGSGGRLEIAVREGSAARELGVWSGARVSVWLE